MRNVVALVVSRRADRVEQAVETAYRIADTVILGLHRIQGPGADVVVWGDDYPTIVNQCLEAAERFAPCVVKIDDHDEYPSNHGQFVGFWKPGHVVHGSAAFIGCDGQYLGRWPTLCASVIPTGISVKVDRHGQISQSVLSQSEKIRVETGVNKLICPGDWSWGLKPGSFRRVECAHHR